MLSVARFDKGQLWSTNINFIMKNWFLISLFLFLALLVHAQESMNVDLFGIANRGDIRYSGSWYYVDSLGAEYALIGARTGTAVYGIDQQDSIVELGFVPGPESNWREITVVNDFAYVVTEGMDSTTGMQVINLSFLPDTIILDTTYQETFTTGHIIQRDIYSDSAFVYVNGTSTTEGVHILDVSDPNGIVEVGVYDPNYYIHDCFVKGNRLFAAAFHNSTIDVVDVNDKSNPVLITQIDDPGGNTHSSWLTEDDNYLIVCDEQNGLAARIWNIADMDDIFEVATYSANLQSLVHNPYIRGDFAFFSHNTEGLRVVDVADPTLPVEVGFYDTFGGESGGFSGLWSACPFLPSGKIIGGDRTGGLFIWTFDTTYAARCYGIVKDSITQELLTNYQISVVETGEEIMPDLLGQFKYGNLADTFTFIIEAEGYNSKTVTSIFMEKDSIYKEIELIPSVDVATETVAKFNNTKIYPNPFYEQLMIELPQNAASLEVYTPLGQLVYTKNTSNLTKIILQKNDLPEQNGLFYFIIKNKGNAVLDKGKFCKQ